MKARHAGSAGTLAAWRLLAVLLPACCMLLLAAAGCAFQKPTVKLHDIEVAGLDFQKLDLAFDFAITNPNPFQISIWGFEYSLAGAGEKFAEGALPQPIASLAAKQTTHLRVPVALLYRSLLPLVKKIGSQEAVPYEMAGKVTFNYLGLKIPVPVRHAGEIPPLRAPSWHFRDVRLAQGTATVVEVVFEVDNPNRFELPLRRLTGALKSGDQALVSVDKLSFTAIPAGKSARLTIPVSIDGLAAAKAVATALTRRESLRFEGEMSLGVPEALRRMLLGKDVADE